MAKSNAVWGIDIGQCALKALRCRPHDKDEDRIVADAFDYIEYPKILSQPEADRTELIREALELFLSRNTVKGDKVAISVSGQSGLARFIKLPPVESKKIPDIVKYEARQQIPFSLDDVVWDYEQMPGGSEDDGFALETEVGLFAMKRDQVYRALEPLDDAGIEVDFIQLAPLSIFNSVVFDVLNELPPPEEYNPDDPPESLVLLSLGTDNTDLVVTNGYRVWQRSIPLGGSHFTKVLSKELKLTFAKAEHLKRNATQAEDPKAVFQAMRPVFNDMLTEVQRSIGYFANIDRKAKIGRVVPLGNAMKLPGLQRYLAQNLGYEVMPLESFRGISGSSVIEAPAFKENIASFSVCYGLCLQGLGKATLSTNLLPKEITTQRLIREKKPFAVAALAALLFGCTVNFLGHWAAWASAHPDRFEKQSTAFTTADSVKNEATRLINDYTEQQTEFEKLSTIGKTLVSNVEGRLLWLEVLKAIDAALPREVQQEGEELVEIGKRRELHIEQIDCEHFEDLSSWFAGIAQKHKEDMEAAVDNPMAGLAPPADLDAEADADDASEEGEDDESDMLADDSMESEFGEGEAEGEGLTGPGWVVQLTGYHYYNEDRNIQGATFVRRTLLKNLAEASVTVPDAAGGEPVEVKIKDLGIGYPVLVEYSQIMPDAVINPDIVAQNEMMGTTEGGISPMGAGALPSRTGGAGMEGAVQQPLDPMIRLRRFNFVVQFSWVPTPPTQRREIREQQLAEAAEAAEASEDAFEGE